LIERRWHPVFAARWLGSWCRGYWDVQFDSDLCVRVAFVIVRCHFHNDDRIVILNATTTRQLSTMCFEHNFGQGSAPLNEYPATRQPSRASLRRCVFTGPRTFEGTALTSAMAPEVARSVNLGAAPRGGRFDATTERDRQDCRGQLELFCLVGVLQCDPPARYEPPGLRDRALPFRAAPLSRQRYVFA